MHTRATFPGIISAFLLANGGCTIEHLGGCPDPESTDINADATQDQLDAAGVTDPEAVDDATCEAVCTTVAEDEISGEVDTISACEIHVNEGDTSTGPDHISCTVTFVRACG